MEFVEYEPEYIPEAVMNYYSCGLQVGRKNNIKDLILKAKKHLSAIGWSFFYVCKKPGRRELRYRSPAGKTYCSLRSACQDLIKHQEDQHQDDRDLDLGGSKNESFMEKKEKLEKNDEFLSNDRPQNGIRIQDDLDLDSKTEILMESEIGFLSNNRPQKGIRIQDDHDLELGSSKTEIFTEKKAKLEKNDEFLSNNRPRKGIRIQDDHDLESGSSKTEILTEKKAKLEKKDEFLSNNRPRKGIRIQDDLDLESGFSKNGILTEKKAKLEKNGEFLSKNRPRKRVRIQDDLDLETGSSKNEILMEKKAKLEKKDEFLSNNRPRKRVRIQDLESGSSEIEMFSEQKTSRPKKKIRIQDVEASYFNQKRQESRVDNSNYEMGILEDDKNEGFLNDRPGKTIKRLMEHSGKKRPEKRIRKRCILSLLIERKIVLRGSKVVYRSRKDGRVMAKGRVYEEGIQCNCCGDFFLLSKFEAHAGSTYRRPAANIFLEDGRSLLNCQTRLLSHENEPKSTKPRDHETRQDDFCSFCNDGGDLVLCDSCTSSFHPSCIGLNGIPDSDYWFCPSCCCQICLQDSLFTNEYTSLFINEYSQIKCKQCEHYFHTNCLKKKGVSLSSDTINWLCSENCERIFSGLTCIAGKSIPTSVDNLSWRLLKRDNDENDMNLCTETYGKLNVALDVMHECFKPLKHPRSDCDVVEDIIFSRSSKRWDFNGFFTAVLEKDGEMITVVTVRVHGCKAAEIPLVATRFRYRKMGMCRILMDEIEKMMKDLGVERIVLPAVPEMVKTWTESFGFKVMDETDRLKLVDCKFLDFPGTVKCQKIIEKM